MTSVQQQVSELILNGGSTYNQIADALDISNSTARDHVQRLREDGEEIASYPGENNKQIFYYPAEETHPSNNNKTYQEKSKDKQAKTNKLNEHLQSMEARLTHLLDNTEPAIADGSMPLHESHEDVVIHRTDAHFGDQLEDEFGNVVFSPEILEEREREVTDKVMRLIERQSKAGIEYDTAHLLLGGDDVTGEHTYANQLAEVVLTLDEQIDRAFEVRMEQIQRLAARFDHVQVVCQPGNHGELEAKYSQGANADRLLYMMLDKAVRQDSSLDNVTFVRNDATGFTNFYVRGDKKSYEESEGEEGWRFHLRHGDDSLEHIGTSSGKKRWYKWLLMHEFDQAYRGHYHKHEIDTIHDDVKCIMTGSPKPPDDFEESIAEWSQPTAFLHGTSDERAMTWSYEVEFDN